MGARPSAVFSGCMAGGLMAALLVFGAVTPAGAATSGSSSKAVQTWAQVYGDRVIGLEEDVASYSELPVDSTAAEDAAWCQRIATDALNDVHTPVVPDKTAETFWRKGVQNLYVGGQACKELAAGHTLYANIVATDMGIGTRSLQSLSRRIALTLGATTTPSTAPNIVIGGQRGRTSFGNGTWTVGSSVSDIAPGVYEAAGGSSCTWARLSPRRKVLVTAHVVGHSVATVNPTDGAFRTSGCRTWMPIQAIGAEKKSFGDGVFAVGIDIAPGTYTTRGGGQSCSWEGLADFTGQSTSVVANGRGPGPFRATVTVSEQGFESQGCGTWKAG